VLHDWNAEPGHVLLRPNAGEHQQLRRVYGSAAQDNLARSAGGAEPAIPAKCHADGTAAERPAFLLAVLALLGFAAAAAYLIWAKACASR
jgi:hypothetical protein